MNFDLTDEQAALARSLDEYLTERYKPGSCLHWRQFAQLGWIGAALPEACGGSAGGPVETMVIMEALGKHLVTEPYLATAVLGAGVLLDADEPAAWQATLAEVIDGTRQLAVAYGEPQSRNDPRNVLTRAVATESGWSLTGRKSLVLNGEFSDVLIVSARIGDGDGIALFGVPRATQGLQVRGFTTQDGLAAADIALADVLVPRTACVVGPERGHTVLATILDAGCVAVGATAVGCMGACVERTADYLRLRRQFGRPLASFQALQHRLVDMHVALEESRSLVLAATIALDAREEVGKAVSAMKILVGECGQRIGEEAVQLHGAIAMTDDFVIGRYYKRLLTCASLFGTVEDHVARYARDWHGGTA